MYKRTGARISEKQICAGGENGKDSCSGDSGGPLMYFDMEEQRWFAEGVVSFGIMCGEAGWPGVYTHLPKYYDWILQHLVKQKNRIT